MWLLENVKLRVKLPLCFHWIALILPTVDIHNSVKSKEFDVPLSLCGFVLADMISVNPFEIRSPSLFSWDTLQEPLGVPDTTDGTKLYIRFVFSCTYTPMVKVYL